MPLRVSIVMPVLNEERALPATLERLRGLEGWPVELVITDGGSTDRTLEIARAFGAKVVAGATGRGPQQHLGALAATGDVLWFLHADTYPPSDALRVIERSLTDPRVIGGHFRLRFPLRSFGAWFLTTYQIILHKLHLVYGDTAIFLRRSVYEEVGGFAAVPLFEDLDLTRRVRRLGRFVTLRAAVTTSSRRFEGRFGRTLPLWLFLQVLYDLGVPPRRLATMYRHLR